MEKYKKRAMIDFNYEGFDNEELFRTLMCIKSNLNNYIKEMNAIYEAIIVLENWKSEDHFKLNKTKCSIYWSGTRKSHLKITEVTLPQAKKLYREVKEKYNILYNLLLEVGEMFDDKEYMIKKYFINVEEI